MVKLGQVVATIPTVVRFLFSPITFSLTVWCHCFDKGFNVETVARRQVKLCIW